jgi:hypothetical protein
VEGEKWGRGALPKGTVKTAEISPIGNFKSCQDGTFLIKQPALQIVGKKTKVPGHSHGAIFQGRRTGHSFINFHYRLQVDSWIR